MSIYPVKLTGWKSGFRDFNIVKEMNDTIIKNINHHVKYDDSIILFRRFSH
jgi:hypothetical protein